jgi:hypothetical protein
MGASFFFSQSAVYEVTRAMSQRCHFCSEGVTNDLE